MNVFKAGILKWNQITLIKQSKNCERTNKDGPVADYPNILELFYLLPQSIEKFHLFLTYSNWFIKEAQAILLGY